MKAALVSIVLRPDSVDPVAQARAIVKELKQVLTEGNRAAKSGSVDDLVRLNGDFPALSDAVLRIQQLTSSDRESVHTLSAEILRVLRVRAEAADEAGAVLVDDVDHVAGEVGLNGEIRPVTRIDQRINEAAKLGFEEIFISSYNKGITSTNAIKIRKVGKVEELFGQLFG